MALDALEPSEVAAAAAAAIDLSAFADDLIERLRRSIGYDVAYHACAPAAPDAAPCFAARRGLSDADAARMVANNAIYGAELLPVKQAAVANGGVAIDSEVLPARERERLRYYVEFMAPVGGRHAMLAAGCVGGELVSVTMLGRTGASFSEHAIRSLQAIVPILGLATKAHARSIAATSSPTLSPRERDLADYVALGFTNADIGRALGTSPRTVRNQLSALYTRIGAANRAELVALVARSAPALAK